MRALEELPESFTRDTIVVLNAVGIDTLEKLTRVPARELQARLDALSDTQRQRIMQQFSRIEGSLPSFPDTGLFAATAKAEAATLTRNKRAS